MDKKLQTTITVVLAVLLVGGGIFFGISQAKKGAKCPFCGKYFPHGEITVSYTHLTLPTKA